MVWEERGREAPPYPDWGKRNKKEDTMKALLSTALVAFLSVAAAMGQDSPPRQAKNNATQAASTNKITGRCHCGYITYEAGGAQAKSDDCECRGCQRASGSLKAQYIIVAPAAVKITGGEPAEFRAKSGVECDAWGVWQFCPKCGSPVFWKSNRGDQIDIFAGTLDDSRTYKPKK